MADFLRRELGWETALAWDEEVLGVNGSFGRLNQKEIVLTRYLEQALRRLNPGLPDSVYQNAMSQITGYSSAQSLIQINRAQYKLLRDGVPVIYRTPHNPEETARLRVFDFDEPAHNHFLAIRELWLDTGLYGRIRPDLLGYVNGLPLLFVELKRFHKSVQDAYTQNFVRYKAWLPALFHHNAVVMLANGDEGRVGTITSPFTYFNEWKRLEEEESGRVDFETMQRGMLDKTHFMDLFENFILFDDSKPISVELDAAEAATTNVATTNTRKILARNHQFLGVNRAFAAANERNVRDGKLGVFWHTQGSGKSYSMAFLAEKIHRKLAGNFTFLVLTDRDDLIVFSDEAHRTQYGIFARNMRHALPHAAYMGFTGTPLIDDKENELTKEIFGDYVSTYDFQRAVEDNATVPLIYDNRGEKLVITTDDLNEQIADIIEDHALEPEVESRVMRALGANYFAITNEDRLKRIAADFVAHYSARWQTGKAMIICLDKLTCVRLHKHIDAEWQRAIRAQRRQVNKANDEQDEVEQRRKLQWLKETERLVVISQSPDEVAIFQEWGMGDDILRVRQRLNARPKLEEEFKTDNHPFRVAIVCAMWLTGFDVESLATLYVDKPMKSHTLMQAIARANRVHEGKANGLIVDYNGILKSLRRALSRFAARHSGGQLGPGIDPTRPPEKLIAEYTAALQRCTDYLAEIGYDLNQLLEARGYDENEEILHAVDVLSRNDESRARFEVLVREMMKKGKSLIGFPALYAYKTEHDGLEAIYKKLKQTDNDPTDLIAVLRELQGAVDEAITLADETPVIAEDRSTYDISKINFDRLRQEFEKKERKNTAVQSLKQKIERQLQRMVAQNPTRVDFYERFQQIIEAYNRETDRVTIEETFAQLLDLVESLNEEQNRYVREGFEDEEQLAAYDLLRAHKTDVPPAKLERIKGLARELITAIKATIAEMDNWRDKEATQAAVRTLIHDALYNEETGLPYPEFGEDDIDVLTDAFFKHVFVRYPSGTA
ncbi:MAG: type I restriction endonuclease subunit R [Anaerolineae bacterium]|nr:type I restriction endonuclease subunit R [Anaerolineae bacterium]